MLALAFFILLIIIFSSALSSGSNILQNSNQNVPSNYNQNLHIETSNSQFIWPIPGYTNISSPFGRRSSPTKYASSFHKGIDIPATPGTNIYAAMSGTVVTAWFNGSGGCTVTIQNGSYFTSYCHVSPNFLVVVGQKVKQGDLIAQVGPKNVYGFPENKYTDANGNPTNGATTGPHLHFAIRYDGNYVNPMDYY